MNQEPSKRFTGIFIPVEVLEYSELTLFEMLLLSWIDALYCPKHRGCYASNQYLGAMLKNAKENTVAKAITKLRSLGLIEDVSFDGRKRVIRACIGRHIDKVQSNADLDLNPTPIGFLSNPNLDKNPTPSYIERKDERKDKNKRACAKSVSIPSKIKFGQFVELTQDQYDALCKEHGKHDVDEFISTCNDYLASTGNKPYKDYAATFRNWRKRELSKAKTFPQKPQKIEDMYQSKPNPNLEERLKKGGIPMPREIYNRIVRNHKHPDELKGYRIKEEDGTWSQIT